MCKASLPSVIKDPPSPYTTQATKKLEFFTLPENLVVHLKRWGFVKGKGARKVETLVQFPTTGLDVSPHMLDKQVCPSSPMHGL